MWRSSSVAGTPRSPRRRGMHRPAWSAVRNRSDRPSSRRTRTGPGSSGARRLTSDISSPCIGTARHGVYGAEKVRTRGAPMGLPNSMRYIQAEAAGGPEVLKLATGPLPEPKPDEVLIRVEAAGVNRPDISQRQGSYPPPPGASPILGLEVAGEVVQAGAA